MHTETALIPKILMTLTVVAPALAGPAWGEDLTSRPLIPLASVEGMLVSKTEITFDQWQSCVDDNACVGGLDDHAWGKGTRPAINMTYDQALDFAAWASAKIGLACRLPSESEWEKAAAAGRSTRFWWGDQPGQNMANCRDCTPTPIYGTVPVASFPANPLGLYDMNGNVWEWTSTCLEQNDPCRKRVIKGGSWYYYSQNATTRARAGNDPRLGSYNIGIRLVCEQP